MAPDRSAAPFGGAKLPRLRVLPTVLFLLLAVLAFGAALPAASGDAGSMAIPLSVWPMALIAAPGLACAAFVAILGHPAAFFAMIPLTAVSAWLFSRDLLTALFAMLLFFPALLLRALLERGTARTPAICRLALCCGAVCLPILYIALCRAWGTMSPGTLFDTAMEELTALFMAVRVESEGKELLAFGAEQSAGIAQLLLILLPSLVILLFNLMAWLAHGLTLFLLRIHGLGHLLTPPMQALALSRPAAVIFLAACLGSVLFSTGEAIGMAEALSLNLVMIFEPPFVLIGFSAIVHVLRSRPQAGLAVLCILMLIMLACSFSICLLIIACVGVGRTLRRAKP